MKTEENENNLRKSLNSKEDILNNTIIKYINILSDSIREYYKVSINIIQNKNILINILEKELFELKSESIQNNTSIKNKEIINNLKLNIYSGKINLKNFFEDAKIIFKEMREYHILVKKKMKKQNSYLGYAPFSNGNRNISPYQRSEINYKIEDNINAFSIKKIHISNERQKEINQNKIFQNQNLKEEFNMRNNFNNKLIEENERLKIINKNYEMNIRKLNFELQKLKKSNSNNNFQVNDNNFKIQEELILNKDQVISSLKKDLDKNNKKNEQISKNYKIIQMQLKNLKEENIKLNSLITSDRSLINKLNTLMKENNKLKSYIFNSEQMNQKSDINYKLLSSNSNLTLSNNNEYLEKENLLKNKILIIEKKLKEEQNKNEILKKENNDFTKKFKFEITKLTKGNNESSHTSINNQKKLLNLQKENLEKSKEIEDLKLSIVSKDNEDKKKLINSIKEIFGKENSNEKSITNLNESVHKILDNYKKENDQLKETKNDFENKLKYLQEQLKNTKINNLEIENINKKEINELRNNYGQKIELEMIKNIDITNRLNSLQELYNLLIKEKEKLNEEIAAKDIKIIKFQIENENYKVELNKLNNIKLSNCILEDNNEDNIKSKCIELNKKLKQEIQSKNELNEELIKLKTENDKLTKKLLSLGIDYIAGQEIQISRDKIIEKLKDEIEQLKERNNTLNGMVESFSNQFLLNINNHNKNKENSSKKEKEKKENKDCNSKCEERIKILKKENEKLTNQIIRLSTNLPEEFNDLQKQYNDLENKYKQLLKNDRKNNNNNINNNINNININSINNNNNEEVLNILKELKDVKKENDEIRKKNIDLISQLEKKDIKRNCFDNKSEDRYLSNYEEEFDLRKMAKGAKEKNRSQDINIDCPGIQNIKEKYRELDFYYNSLESLVKKLLSTIQVNQKNKTYVNELCKIVGFDLETTNKILNNKNKKLLLGIFLK